MKLLKTPRPDLPQSIIDRLILIKTFFMELHPSIPEGPLVTMLNAALTPRHRKTSIKEFVQELFHGLPAKVDTQKGEFTKAGLKLTRADLVKVDTSHEALTTLCVEVLLRDGLHPMATLTGYHLNHAQADELKQADPDRIRDFDLLDWGCEFDKISPLLYPAIVILDTAEHAVLFDQKSIADHHRRFAPLLSNKRDPLHACWEETFAPKTDRFERNGAKVTQLTKAIGAITETLPECASDRVKNSDWTYIAKHLWAVSGYVAELGEIRNPDMFLADTLKHPAQIDASTLLFLARSPGHTLGDIMIERYAQHAMAKNIPMENLDLLLAAAHCPELGHKVNLGYEEIMEGAFAKLFANLDLETVDFALTPISQAWGRPIPSKDIGLIGTKIPRHEQWQKAVRNELPLQIQRHYEQHETFPEALKNGQIAPSFIPDHLIKPFISKQMQSVISKGTAEYLISLQKDGKVDAAFIINALSRGGRNKDNSRLAKAFHQGVFTHQQLFDVYPRGLDRIMQADLGM